MNKLSVAIPLKTSSMRVRNKNLRPFVDGKSLFDLKAEQLLKLFDPGDVYVSSENPKAEEAVRKYGFNFLIRDVALTKPNAAWGEVIKDIVNQIPAGNDIVWTQVTQPLFDEFDKVMETWQRVKDNHDSLAVVKKFSHHLIDASGNPVNFNYGYWHKQSQELPSFYQLTWACFVMKRQMVESCWYNIGKTPYLYDTAAPLVDIDTDQEFEIASILYKHYKAHSAPKLTVTSARTEVQVSAIK